jgi:succinoglycan biosynthesis protein ExoH
MKLSKEISMRIAMLRPILIMGVVLVHVSGDAGNSTSMDHSIFNFVASFFQNGLFRGTVPTMSLIAGFLVFHANLDQYPGALFRKKFMTLVIPFVIFNLLCLAFMVATNALLGPVFFIFPHSQNLLHQIVPSIFGFYDYPIDGPLHFVRDMIVTVGMVPLLGYMIRHAPVLGLLALVTVFGMNFDGYLIFRASSLILFYIGGVAAVHQWNLLFLDKYAKPGVALLLIICAVTTGLRFTDNTVLVITAPFLIWSSASLLKNTRIEAWAVRFSKYSFFIFAAHMPLLALSWWVTTHHIRWIPYPVYWLLAPIGVIAFLKIMYDVAIRIMPKAFNFALGARASIRVYDERRKTYRPAGAPVYSPELRLALIHS